MGTVSFDWCAVASGRMDAYFERTLSPWDHEAGGLIAVVAGALVTGVLGARVNHRFLLAAHPDLVRMLAPVLTDLGAVPLSDEGPPR